MWKHFITLIVCVQASRLFGFFLEAEYGGMHCLVAFPSSRILQPCSRARGTLQVAQLARSFTSVHVKRGSQSIGTRLAKPSWNWSAGCSAWLDFEARVERRARWSSVRSFASLQEAEKERRVEGGRLREAMETGKEVGLAEKKGEKKLADAPEKPEMCTADELHYVPVPDTDWRLALWRYLPSKNASS